MRGCRSGANDFASVWAEMAPPCIAPHTSMHAGPVVTCTPSHIPAARRPRPSAPNLVTPPPPNTTCRSPVPPLRPVPPDRPLLPGTVGPALRPRRRHLPDRVARASGRLRPCPPRHPAHRLRGGGGRRSTPVLAFLPGPGRGALGAGRAGPEGPGPPGRPGCPGSIRGRPGVSPRGTTVAFISLPSVLPTPA